MNKTLFRTLMIGAGLAALTLSGCAQEDNSGQIAMLSQRVSEAETLNHEQAKLIQMLQDKLEKVGTGSANVGLNLGSVQDMLDNTKTALYDDLVAEVNKLRAEFDGKLANLPAGSGAGADGARVGGAGDPAMPTDPEELDALAKRLREREEARRDAERAEREERMKAFVEEIQADYPELDPEASPQANGFKLLQAYGPDEAVKVMGRFVRAQRFSRTELPQRAIDTIESAERRHLEQRVDTYRRLQAGEIDADTAKIEREAAQNELDSTLESSLSADELKQYEDAASNDRMGQMLNNPEMALGMMDRFKDFANGGGMPGAPGGNAPNGGNGNG